MTLLPLLQSDTVIQIHVGAALAAVLLGAAAWARRSRDSLHRLFGYAWVVAMAVTAISAAFIFTLHIVGPFSPIHLLIPVVLAALWRGVAHARGGRIDAHRSVMTGLYVQALGIAGLFTLLPDRILGRVLFPQAPWTGFALSAVVIGGAVLAHFLHRRRASRRAPDSPARPLVANGGNR